MDARQAWDEFRRRFREIEPEFLRGITELVGRFNVSERSNRFVVGDVVEYLLAGSFYAMGILILPRGGNQNDFDLDSLVQAMRGKFSVKSSFSKSRPAIGMKNKQGDADWEWADPVIFVLAGVGIVYADPKVHTDLAAKIVDAKDAFKLSIKAIRDHAKSNPDCVIETAVPFNPRTGRESAGRTVFSEIFDHAAYPTIRNFLQRTRANVEGTPIFEALAEARALKERGDLKEDAYEALVDALIARVGGERPA
ncbi:MAG TPA: hypothetical protein VHR55_12680 [Candidatus Limnocylindria bacterium]|nr:hypothetical protein [Candidatus Limnocylindria bacterium]